MSNILQEQLNVETTETTTWQHTRRTFWSKLGHCLRYPVAWNNLQFILSENIDRYAPFINKRVKGKPAPWLTPDVKAAMNHRDTLHRKFIKSKLPTDWNAYKLARNRANNIVHHAQKTHYKSILANSEHNPNKFWKMIKQIFPTKTKESPVRSFVINGNYTTDKKTISSGFCSFFSNVAGTLNTKCFSLKNFVTVSKPTLNSNWNL